MQHGCLPLRLTSRRLLVPDPAATAATGGGQEFGRSHLPSQASVPPSLSRLRALRHWSAGAAHSPAPRPGVPGQSKGAAGYGAGAPRLAPPPSLDRGSLCRRQNPPPSQSGSRPGLGGHDHPSAARGQRPEHPEARPCPPAGWTGYADGPPHGSGEPIDRSLPRLPPSPRLVPAVPPCPSATHPL